VGCSIWQTLPLGPTGYGDSPYQCFSAFAGNPLLIHVPNAGGTTPDGDVDFAAVLAFKRRLLADRFRAFVPDDAYMRWVASQDWLEDFALFTAIKEAHEGRAWTGWPEGLATRDPKALEAFRRVGAATIARVKWEQFIFFRQLDALRRGCRARGVRLMGDVPIYVAHDSATSGRTGRCFSSSPTARSACRQAFPGLFQRDRAAVGQPDLRLACVQGRRVRWWIRRMRAALAMFDIVRLDHFRGFEAYWEVPGDAPTAAAGRWVPGPGLALFETMTAALGPLPIVAENLGLITPEVETLRAALGYPA
jgi:4-alpha-glucanotransferase